jgi:hypothetical protein
MKQLLFLTLLFATAQLYGQAPIHFLITSDQQINITEPLCEDMIKETNHDFAFLQVEHPHYCPHRHPSPHRHHLHLLWMVYMYEYSSLQ